MSEEVGSAGIGSSNLSVTQPWQIWENGEHQRRLWRLAPCDSSCDNSVTWCRKRSSNRRPNRLLPVTWHRSNGRCRNAMDAPTFYLLMPQWWQRIDCTVKRINGQVRDTMTIILESASICWLNSVQWNKTNSAANQLARHRWYYIRWCDKARLPHRANATNAAARHCR